MQPDPYWIEAEPELKPELKIDITFFLNHLNSLGFHVCSQTLQRHAHRLSNSELTNRARLADNDIDCLTLLYLIILM